MGHTIDEKKIFSKKLSANGLIYTELLKLNHMKTNDQFKKWAHLTKDDMQMTDDKDAYEKMLNIIRHQEITN